MISRFLDANFLRGALFILAAEFVFVTVAVSIRQVSNLLEYPQIVFFRNAVALLVILPWLIRHGMKEQLHTQLPAYHLLRGLAGISAMYCFFYAIISLPLAEAMLLKMTAPLFMPVIAFLWLKEEITAHIRWAVVIGFVGVALVLTPDFNAIEPVSVIALAGGAFAALAKVTIRRLSDTEPTSRTVFYFALIGSCVSAFPLLWFWQAPSAQALAWLALIGVQATLAQLLMTRGYACTPASRLAPFTYFSVVFGALVGWLLWQEHFSLNALVGSILIISAGLFMALQNKNRKMQIID